MEARTVSSYGRYVNPRAAADRRPAVIPFGRPAGRARSGLSAK